MLLSCYLLRGGVTGNPSQDGSMQIVVFKLVRLAMRVPISDHLKDKV